jgi:WD40 repeat protein
MAGEPPIGPIARNALRAGVNLRRRRAGAAGSATVVAAIAIAVPAIMGHSVLPATGPSPRHEQPDGMGGYGDRPAELAFSPNGKILVTADTDGTARLWNVATQRQIGAPIRVKGKRINDVAFSPSGRIVATADSDGTARLWNAATHHQVGAPFRVSHAQVLGVAFSPNGRMLATAGRDGARLWNVATRRGIGAAMNAGRGPVVAVTFSLNGRLLATTGYDGSARIWSAATQRQAGKPLATSGVITVTFSPDSKLVATVGAGFGFTRVLSVATDRQIGTLMSAGFTSAFGVAFTPDGKTLVTTDTDGTIRQWSVATHHQIRRPIAPKGHPEFLLEALSPNGMILATTQFAGPARLWNLSPAGHH